MADEIKIVLKVDDKGSVSVKKFGNEAEKSGKKATKAFDDVDKSAKTFSSTIKGAIGTFAAFFAVQKISELVSGYADLTDQYKQMKSQLKLVTNSNEELIETQDNLFELANKNRTEFETTVNLYARLSRSTKELNVSQRDLLSVTEAIQQAGIVSGATTEEFNNSVIQLSQGLAGALRAEELNSVLEQTPRLAKAIADGLGVTIGQLRTLGSEGKLTAEAVFGALKSQAQIINSEFGQVIPTIDQNITVLGNNFGKLVNKIDSATGASELFGKAIGLVNSAVESLLETSNFDALTENQEYQIKNNREIIKQISTLKDAEMLRKELIYQINKGIDESLGNMELTTEQAKIITEEYKNQIKSLDSFIDATLKSQEAEVEAKKKTAEIRKKVDEKNAQRSLDTEQEIYNNIAILEQAKINLYNEKNKERWEKEKETQDALLDYRIQQEEEFARFLEQIKESTNELVLSETDLIKSEYNERLAAFESYKEQEIITQEEYDQAIIAAEKNKAAKIAQIENIKNKKTIEGAKQVATETSGATRELFPKSKAAAIADIGINAAVAELNILSKWAWNPPVAVGLSAALGLATAASIKQVNAQKLATGTEYVNGPGTATSDSVPAQLSRGERVVPAAINEKLNGIPNEQLPNYVSGGGNTYHNTYVVNGQEAYRIITNIMREGELQGWQGGM